MTFEELKRAIVHVALNHAPATRGKVLVYAELQEGELSSALFYEERRTGETVFEEDVAELHDLVRELWEQSRQMPGKAPWSVLACLVEGDRVEFDFSSPGLLTEGQSRLETHLMAFRAPYGGGSAHVAMNA